mmetsp:Transcript_31104/g.56585  ORF Transcript_31104/g.56585 Transcript_31104/m.56585 type:complete len:134 (+) Transcript_31104:77-478(+)
MFFGCTCCTQKDADKVMEVRDADAVGALQDGGRQVEEVLIPTQGPEKDLAKRGCILFEMNGEEFEVQFKHRPIGLEFENQLPIVVCKIRGHAEELGVKIGWTFKAIEGVPIAGKDFNTVRKDILAWSESLAKA